MPNLEVTTASSASIRQPILFEKEVDTFHGASEASPP
jgi:hypothetical protein